MRASQARLVTSVAVSLVLFISAIVFYLGISVLHVNADRLVETGGEVKWSIENGEETLEFCHDRIATKAASTHNQEKEAEEHRLGGDVEVKENLTANVWKHWREVHISDCNRQASLSPWGLSIRKGGNIWLGEWEEV